jgi:hypothetical protein
MNPDPLAPSDTKPPNPQNPPPSDTKPPSPEKPPPGDAKQDPEPRASASRDLDLSNESITTGLDYSHESITDKVEAPQAGNEYDPRPYEDAARRWIAYSLIALLSVTVFGIFLLLAFDKLKVGEIKEFAVLLGPLVTLVSAATGFYYGTKATKT